MKRLSHFLTLAFLVGIILATICFPASSTTSLFA